MNSVWLTDGKAAQVLLMALGASRGYKSDGRYKTPPALRRGRAVIDSGIVDGGVIAVLGYQVCRRRHCSIHTA